MISDDNLYNIYMWGPILGGPKSSTPCFTMIEIESVIVKLADGVFTI